jgi:hypothetical protein
MIQSAANLGFPTPEDMENGYNTYLDSHTRSVLPPPLCPNRLADRCFPRIGVGTVNRAMANGRRLSSYDIWLPEVGARKMQTS